MYRIDTSIYLTEGLCQPYLVFIFSEIINILSVFYYLHSLKETGRTGRSSLH